MKNFLQIMQIGAFHEMYSQMKLIPEFMALEQVEQDKEYHPEGNVLNHTFHVALQQYDLCHMLNLWADERAVRMLAAWFHDFGKAKFSYVHENGHIRADGHAMESAKMAERILPTLGVPDSIVSAVSGLCREHMNHVQSERALNRMEERLRKDGATMEQFIAQKIADKWGRPPHPRDLSGSLLESVTTLERFRGESPTVDAAREIVRINGGAA